MAAPRTLILMRHAAAGHQGALRDVDRPLTPDGARDAAVAGDWIRRNLPTVDAALCSPAVRTQQTLAATGLAAPTSLVEELYGGGIDDILQVIGSAPDSAVTVLVMGHAPGIPATAAELTVVAAQTESDHEPGQGSPALDQLRSFSAGALAVLSTAAGWKELAEVGAELVTVRHPGR